MYASASDGAAKSLPMVSLPQKDIFIPFQRVDFMWQTCGMTE